MHQAQIPLRFGELAAARGQFAQAESYFREAQRRFAATLSPGSPKTALARIELGGVLLQEQRYAEAERELLAGYEVVTRDETYLEEAASEARADLGALYDRLQRPDLARKFRAELGSRKS